MIATHLELLPVLPEHRRAIQRGSEELRPLIKLAIPDDWPEFPEAFAGEPKHDPDWPAYFFVDRTAGALVGNGGFYGPPSDTHEVEIGYEVAPAHQNKGYATAAAKALVAIAFARPIVQAVIAHTLAERNASNAVLGKAGFTFVGERANPEVGTVWKWRLSRVDRRSTMS